MTGLLGSNASGSAPYTSLPPGRKMSTPTKFGLKLNIQKTKIMASGPITSWQIDGKHWKQCQTLFLGAPKSLQMVIAVMKFKDIYSWEGKL